VPASNPIWCGPGAGRTLADGGVGTVVAAFGGGGYLRLPGGYVLLAPAGSPRGPLSLLVRGLPAPQVRTPVTVWSDAATLTVGGAVISLAGVQPPRSPVRPGRIAAAARRVAHAALAAVAPAPAELRPGLLALARGSWTDGVRALAGLGDGLTPAGDDALAGWAAWRWAAGAPVAVGELATERCSPIGLAYLECAVRGELPGFAGALLAAIAAGDAAGAGAQAERAGTWGGSSGAALVWGLAAGAAAQRGESQLHAPATATATAA
jgi:hypothetical protein